MAKDLYRPTRLGLEQFCNLESKGIRPENPDPYFVYLCDGKAWWEWTLNYIAEQFSNDEWPGWLCYAYGFWHDPAGFKQLRQRVRRYWNVPGPDVAEFIIAASLLDGEVFLGLGI